MENKKFTMIFQTISKKKRILVVPADTFACGHYRVYEPYNLMHRVMDSEKFTVEVLDISNVKEIRGDNLKYYDAVMFQRPSEPSYFSVISQLKQLGVKIVIETDDHLLNVSPTNPAYKYFKPGGEQLKAYTNCLKLADAVHVSTPELATEVQKVNKNVHVFGNGINLEKEVYRNRPPRLSDKTIVMWSGSTSHWDSLLVIKSAIEMAIIETDAIFAFCSNREFFDRFDLPDDKKVFIEPVNMQDYAMIPGHADIFLTPVEDTPFNACKSELKILESAVYGIPSISSPVAPYTRFNAINGGNILVKKNKSTNWKREIVNLVNNKELIVELGRKSRTAVENVYDLDKINLRRVEFWRNFL